MYNHVAPCTTMYNHDISPCQLQRALLQIVAMQLQHEQIMHNLRSSTVGEIRRALHNQAVDLARQHQTDADYVAKGRAIAARDRALLELQELQQLHNQLNIKVLFAHLCL